MTRIEQLYQTLNERRRPEDVAEMVIELSKDSLTTKERLILEKAAKGSLAKNIFGYTSMLQTFAEAIFTQAKKYCQA
jgi:FixJ family two-component response regulator